MEADVIFLKKKHIEGFIEALQEGIVKIEQNSPKQSEGGKNAQKAKRE